MDRMWLGLALAGVMAVGDRGTPMLATRQELAAGRAQGSAGPTDALPPAAWLQGDPADSVYRAARAALDRRDYRQAAELFAQLPSRFPRSGYAADDRPDDRTLIREGLDRGGVLSRLRTEVPAGSTPTRGDL